jgi:hypothetical protein
MDRPGWILDGLNGVPPWTGGMLTIDAIHPLADNLATTLEYLTG